MTPHISAKLGEIAKTVVLIGDPVHVNHLAHKYLDNVRKVSDVRYACYFTGEYKGKTYTFGTSGMGVGSAGIYIHELYDVYKVERIIRVGSCGSYTDTIALGDTALINESVTEDTLLPDLFYDGKSMPYLKPNEELTEKLRQSAKKLGYDLPEGRSYCKDVLYAPMTADDMATKFGVKLAEFESYALFFYADMMGKKAAALAAVVGTRDPVTNMPVLLAAEKHMDMRCKAIEIVLNAGLED